jgi:hypothetical protein
MIILIDKKKNMYYKHFRFRTVLLTALSASFASCEPANDLNPNAPVFTAFSVGGQAAVIDAAKCTVKLTVACGTNIAALTPEFTLSPEGATATTNGKTQTSGTTAVNCAEPVTYTLITADGQTTAEWTVTVTLPDDCPTVKKYITYMARLGGLTLQQDRLHLYPRDGDTYDLIEY